MCMSPKRQASGEDGMECANFSTQTWENVKIRNSLSSKECSIILFRFHCYIFVKVTWNGILIPFQHNDRAKYKVATFLTSKRVNFMGCDLREYCLEISLAICYKIDIRLYFLGN